MKPLGYNVLIEKDKIKDTTENGIIIQSNDETPMNKGKVIKVGNKVSEVKEGDMVLFKPYLFEEIEIDKMKYVIGKEENIFLVLC